MNIRKFFVYFTLIGMLCVFCVAAIGVSRENTQFTEKRLVTIEAPTFGNLDSSVELVLLEDFKCKHCKSFSEHFFPELTSKYLEPGKIRFTLVPLAFLKGSKPLANAALAVYDLSPDRFLPFVLELFHKMSLAKKGASIEAILIETAQKVGGIELQSLKECIKTHCHEDELERNYEWAKELMGEDFGTPALYLNGEYIAPSQYSSIWKRLDLAIKEAK